MKKIKLIFKGLINSVFPAALFVSSIALFVKCDSLKGYDAITIFATAVISMLLSLVCFYEIGIWQENSKKYDRKDTTEKDKKPKMPDNYSFEIGV